MQLAFAGVFGAIFGSFLNVVTYRLPRHQSVVAPSSRCTSCQTPVRPYDNIPILSWLLLRGRCRSCGESISPRYPLVEAATAGLCLATIAVGGSTATVALGILLVLLVVPCAVIDLEHRIIPNAITGPGALLALALGCALGLSAEPSRLIAGAAAGGFFLIAALAYPKGMGMGDVKLAAVMGLCLGSAVAPAVLIALVSGVAGGALLIVRGGSGQGRRTAIPFGPFLALGAVAAIFVGPTIVNWYVTGFLH